MRFVLASGRRVALHMTSTRATWNREEEGRRRRPRHVVFCHSAPGAGIFDPDPARTRARGVTLLALDRPGYGRSDPVAAGEWATVGSAADDVAAVLDSLRVGQVGAVGWSAGGRVALALAARRPDLVDRVVVVATPAPDAAVPWLDAGRRAELERLREAPAEDAHAELQSRLRSLAPGNPFSGDALWLLAALTSGDTELRDCGVRRRLAETVRAAFAQGTAGLAADLAGYCLRPWGFEPHEIRAKTLLLYGSHDPLAGPRHGRWWHERLPDARLEVLPGVGHLVVVPAWARALTHLAPSRSRTRAAGCLGLRETGTDHKSSAA